MILVKAPDQSEISALVDNVVQSGNFPKWARGRINKNLPSFLSAFDTETGESATFGFKSRRTSHGCEITWWGGDRLDLLKASLKGCIYTAIWEGRKRVEVFNEVIPGAEPLEAVSKWNDQVEIALREVFVFEGQHPDYTEDLETVNVYGHVWHYDGIPEPESNEKFVILNNEAVQSYREKNLELYARDIDLYREDEKGKTFAQYIDEALETLIGFDNLTIAEIPGWHGMPRKSEGKIPGDFEVTVDA